jgi:serine protease Do
MQNKKIYIIIIIIAVVSGSLGGLVIDRFLLPFLSSINGLSFLSSLKSDAPIIINRREEIHYNDGANTIELAKEASKYVYDIYVTRNKETKFAGLGVTLTNDGIMAVSRDSIDKATEIFAVSSSGNTFRASIKSVDTRSNLALISIAVSNTSVPTFSDAFDLKSGQKIIAIGPLARFLEREFSSGFVIHPLSLKNGKNTISSSDLYEEKITSTFQATDEYLGAPMINLDGRLVALVLGKDNIFPAEYLQGILRGYLQNQKISHLYFGIEYTLYSSFQGEVNGMKQSGVMVNRVEVGSASQKAGLKAGDVIIKIDGQNLASTSFERILNTSDKDKYNFTIVRDTEELNIDVTLERK